MGDIFFYGTLCHPPLLAAVLGHAHPTRPARLAGHRVAWARGHAFPVLVQDGDGADGLLASGLDDEAVARLDYYEGGFGYVTRAVTIAVDGRTRPARVYDCAPGLWPAGADWNLADWAARFGDAATATAEDVLALRGRKPAAEVLARYPAMLARGASRVRAARPGPATLRRVAREGDVVIEARDEPYARFFAVEDYRLRHRRFDGGLGETLDRAVFVSCDAAVVLPYDPRSDRVLLVEQFRSGPMARGDRQPWLLETVAGRVDPGETPEEAARREAREEAGLELGPLLPAGGFYPSPAAKSEYLYAFVGLADLPEAAPGSGGVAGEGEDIRTHVVAFARLMELVESGEINNGPLIVLALWLAMRRDGLRAGTGGT